MANRAKAGDPLPIISVHGHISRPLKKTRMTGDGIGEFLTLLISAVVVNALLLTLIKLTTNE